MLIICILDNPIPPKGTMVSIANLKAMTFFVIITILVFFCMLNEVDAVEVPPCGSVLNPKNQSVVIEFNRPPYEGYFVNCYSGGSFCCIENL
jgi:hypothetical protein